MTKNTFRLKTTSKLILSLILLASSFNLFADNTLSYQSEIGNNHQGIASKRQVVDMILQEAHQIHLSPVRVSSAGYTAKMPSHIDLITQKLIQAYELEPYRTDLLITAANAQTFNNAIPRALELFEQAHQNAPDDKDILTYLTVWTHVLGEKDKNKTYFDLLKTKHPTRANEVSDLFTQVDRILETPLKEKATRDLNDKGAIVTLGYALNPDGTMHEILIARLEKTLEIANQYPKSLIVLTGGVPQNAQTEGKLMADWLIAKGIDKSRIIEENYATSTVENALYSAYALAKHEIKHATIISSASHVRRGQAVFELATLETGPKNITFDTVSYADTPLEELQKASEKEITGIYRDALRTMGLWSYRSAPLIER